MIIFDIIFSLVSAQELVTIIAILLRARAAVVRDLCGLHDGG